MLGKTEGVDKLYKVQETIGLWHDYDVTIDSIKKFDKHSDIEVLSKKRDLLYNDSLLLLKNL